MSTPDHARPTMLLAGADRAGLERLAACYAPVADVLQSTTRAAARRFMEEEWVQVAVCAERLADGDGLALLAEIGERWPEVVRVAWLADPRNGLARAVERARVSDYLSPSDPPPGLRLKLTRALELFGLRRENERLALELRLRPRNPRDGLARQRAAVERGFDHAPGILRSPESCMNAVCETIRRVAPYDINVLITGESGTGKELCARALHNNSLRRAGPFVAENCAALPDELLAAELFGHRRGAFTGAVADRVGLFEQADGGTLFLDEIGDMSAALQAKLLRVLQEGEVRPLGGTERRRIDVRVIAATNRDLEADVASGRFRRDLYYRLATFSLHVPPLRERPEDVAALAQGILEETMEQLGKRVRGFTAEALACMRAYAWPGNVRELQNEVKRMLVLAQGDRLGAELLSPRVLHGSAGAAVDRERPLALRGTLRDRVEALEARILKETLIRNRWNKTRAAQELGLSRVGLRAKLERYGLEPVPEQAELAGEI